MAEVGATRKERPPEWVWHDSFPSANYPGGQQLGQATDGQHVHAVRTGRLRQEQSTVS
jgi:hypothetical protein